MTAFPSGSVSAEAAVRLHAEMRRSLNEKGLASPLRSTLENMVAPHAADRLTAGAVTTTMTTNFEAMTAPYRSIGASPNLVAYIANEFVNTAWKWGWIALNPETPDGEAELTW